MSDPTSSTSYDQLFYDYNNRVSQASARVVLPILKDRFDVKSVVCFGCGSGGWIATWRNLGVTDYIGVDGDYLNPDQLLFDKTHFVPADLEKPVNLGKRFDLVESLEVGEHLKEQCCDTFVDTLVAHGDVVLFSAAPPGQGGMRHINEKPYAFWRDLFKARGYVMLDMVRPHVINNQQVMPWYRFNSFVFVSEAKFNALPEELKRTRVPDADAVPDLSPAGYKLRKAVVRCMPVGMMDVISRINSGIVVRRANARAGQ